MRHIGRPTSEVQALTGSAALRQATVHQATGSALTAVGTVGMAKGIYGLKTQEEANAHADDALACAFAINVAERRVAVASRK